MKKNKGSGHELPFLIILGILEEEIFKYLGLVHLLLQLVVHLLGTIEISFSASVTTPSIVFIIIFARYLIKIYSIKYSF
ncbi:hypothetical protein KO488_10420 [Poseidonibacter lekithochrous]|uniref:hypothetical protein n=1 Tax=Poseidonibacter TaxID=2321187 RepID=UPI001C093419|nr:MULTISPECIES: hypothetical protein [Poseidonibacter]MBU3015173.1 hypothetical protein [Poseidonibacter lekithochrous]MDO6828470.1 hypothetical protein [Poseidonibacter sp. 1_MG-2023]